MTDSPEPEEDRCVDGGPHVYTNMLVHNHLTGETHDERACIRCGYYRSAAETVNSGKAQMESRGAGPALGRDHHPTGADNQAAEPPCEACESTAERIGMRLPHMGIDLAPTVFDEHHALIVSLRAEIKRLKSILLDVTDNLERHHATVEEEWGICECFIPAPCKVKPLIAEARRALAKEKEK